MVDVQERDTRRSLDEDAPAENASAETGHESAQPIVTDGGEPDEGHDAGEAEHNDGHEEEHHDGGREEKHHHDHEEAGSHDHHAHDLETVSAAVVTISSTRSIEDDPAGDAIVDALETAGHEITTRDLVRDDYDGVQSAIDQLLGRDDVDAVVTTGGTGVAPDDVTPEAVEHLFDKELPGFGETFRALSFEEIGTQVVATRAVAGVAEGVPVFCLPGSEAAARLGTAEIIAPEVGHLAGLAHYDEDEE